MSPSKKYNGNTSSAAATATATKAIKSQRNNRVLLPSASPLATVSSKAPSTASALITSNIDTSSLFEETQLLVTPSPAPLPPPPPQRTTTTTTATSVSAADEIASLGSLKNNEKVSRTMPSFKIMSYQNIIALLTVLVCGLVTVNGLKCHMCGQYNEGVGSITPCLNYSDQYAHLYLKECSKKSEKYCVKYVSELSTVRDCATECAEKEIWETQTYCCTEDGCNGSAALDISSLALMVPLFAYMCNAIWNVIKGRR